MVGATSIEKDESVGRKQVLVASGVLAWVPTNRVVVMKRRDNTADKPLIRNPNKWELASGKLASGDNDLLAVILREIKEELGIKSTDIHKVFRLVDQMPIIHLDDDKDLIIGRIKMAFKRMPKIRLREGRSDHVQVRFVNRDEFLELVGDDGQPEGGVFVPGIESFLKELFNAAEVRGTIIDALAPGVELDIRAVTFSSNGSKVLYNPLSCNPKKVGAKEHIDDIIRAMFPGFTDPIRRKVLQWAITEQKPLNTVRASLGIVLTSPGLDALSSLPEHSRWLETSSDEVEDYIHGLRPGFYRRFLRTAVQKALRPHPVFSDWMQRDSMPVRGGKSRRGSGTYPQA